MNARGARVGARRRRDRWLGIVTLVVGCGLGVAPPAWATSPTGTLEAFFARTNAVLQSVDQARGLGTPRQAIRDLVNDVFDFQTAAALALGSVWLSRVPEDQHEFTRLFALFLERGFVAMLGSKASVAGGVSIQYLGESIEGNSAGVATTLLTRGGQALPVDYWMVRRGDGWKVQDVVVDGVSLVQNYRAQFARILAAYPYAELVARMQGERPSEPSPASSRPGPSAPSPPPSSVARDLAASRSVKPEVVKPGPPPPQIQTSRTSRSGAPREARPAE